MARALDSLEPFCVDCDVRWIKNQRKGSLGFSLYLDHVLNQSMNVINSQNINTLFTTPPLLQTLAERMNDEQRARIKGIHTGGLSLSNSSEPLLKTLFPNSVLLPGYGNSLLGVTFPFADDQLNVFQAGDEKRLFFQIGPLPEKYGDRQDLQNHVTNGKRGRIICHRLDQTFLLVNLVERDTAVATEVNGVRGLAAIKPLTMSVSDNQQGVY